MKEKLCSILKVLVCLTCFFTIGYIASLVLYKFGVNVSNLGFKGQAILEFIISLTILIIFVLIYYKDLKKDLINLKKNLKSNINFILKTFIIFMIIKFLVGVLSAIIMQLLGIDVNSLTSVNQDIVQKYLLAAPVLMLTSCSLLAPIYEETLFRLGFKKVLGKGFIFIIISGFIFGLMHVFPLEEGVSLQLGLIQSLSYVTMGLFLAYAYNKTDNIFCSIGIHFLNNFLSVITILKFF